MALARLADRPTVISLNTTSAIPEITNDSDTPINLYAGLQLPAQIFIVMCHNPLLDVGCYLEYMSEWTIPQITNDRDTPINLYA